MLEPKVLISMPNTISQNCPGYSCFVRRIVANMPAPEVESNRLSMPFPRIGFALFQWQINRILTRSTKIQQVSFAEGKSCLW
jgi:hypothetical protein